MAYKYKYAPTKLTNPYKKSNSATKALQTQKTNLENRFKAQGIDPANLEGDMDKRNIVEKALNLKQDQGALFDLFEVLDRPRNVIANMVESMGDKNQGVLEGAWEGLSGNEDVRTKDAIENATGADLEIKGDGIGAKIGNFAVDVGLDIASDPLTYIPGGAIAKGAGKIGSKAGKIGAEAIEAGVKAGGKIGAVSEFANKAKDGVKAFSTKFGHLMDAKKGFTDEMNAGVSRVKGTVDEFKAKANGRLGSIKKEVNALDSKGGKYVGEALENNIVFKENGLPHYKSFNQTGGEMLNDLTKNLNRKGTSRLVLARTTKGGVGKLQVDNLVKKMDDFAKGQFANADDPWKSMFNVKRGKSRTHSVLEFKGTSDELVQLRKMDGFKDIEEGIVNFGERRMSNKARDFFKNNESARNAVEEVKVLRTEARELMQQVDEAGLAKYFKTFGDDLADGSMGYMRHTVAEGAEELLSGSAKAVAETFTSPGSARFGERSYKATARDINKTLEEVYGHSEKLFDEDAFKAMEDMIENASKTYSQTQMAELVLDPNNLTKDGKGMFQSISENTKRAKNAELGDGYKLMDEGTFQKEFSNLNKNLPPEMKANLDAMLNSAGATGDAVGMQRSAYDMMKRFDRAYKEVPKFWKNYDNLLNKWKSLNLISGGFHTRNFAGNTTNMYLAGMNANDIMKYTKDSFIERGRYKKLFKEVSDGAVLKGTDKKFYDEVAEFYKSGISQGHAGVRDLAGVQESIAKKAGKEKGILGKAYDKVEKTNYKWAEEADDLQRYAMWKWAKKKHGGDMTKAGKEVNNALFDYSSLTSFEREVNKRMVPFYTFMKNNIAFQGKNLAKNPGKYAKLGRGYDSFISNMTDVERDELPDYMQENMWLPIPSMFNLGDSDDMSFLKLNLPPAEFAEFVSNPLKRGVTSVTVPVKLAWELGTNTNSFTGAPIKKYAGQRDGGYKDGFRNEKGSIALGGSPTMQKIFDDLGMRQPRNYASILTDFADWATGGQTQDDFTKDVGKRLGITDTKDMSKLELTKLYQELEKLRNDKKVYEQETGQKLPTLN